MTRAWVRRALIGLALAIGLAWAGTYYVRDVRGLREQSRSPFPCTVEFKIVLAAPEGITVGQPFRGNLRGRADTVKNGCRTITLPSSSLDVTYQAELTADPKLVLTPQPVGQPRTEYPIQGSTFRLHEEKPVGGSGCRLIQDTEGQLSAKAIELSMSIQVVGPFEQCQIVRFQ